MNIWGESLSVMGIGLVMVFLGLFILIAFIYIINAVVAGKGEKREEALPMPRFRPRLPQTRPPRSPRRLRLRASTRRWWPSSPLPSPPWTPMASRSSSARSAARPAGNAPRAPSRSTASDRIPKTVI